MRLGGGTLGGGIPARYSIPALVGTVGLMLGGAGESSDVAYHVDFGRDESLLTVPHSLILAAITLITLSGVLALLLPGPVSERAVKVGRRRLPAGGLIVVACATVALAAFPLDGTWHALFGEDLTLWSPTHLLLIGGPTLSILGLVLLVREGAQLGGGGGRTARWAQVVLLGFLLGALTDLQGEFGFGVPQFRLLYHPITVAVTAGFALVLARVVLGRYGALKTLAVYYVVGALPLAAGLLEADRTVNRMPLYLAAAVAVEVVAAHARRPLVLGALAGLAAGTIGVAAEWAWSQVWMPYPWSEGLLPEAALLTATAGTAAGVLAARVGVALTGSDLAAGERRLPAAPAVAAALALIAVLAVPLPRSGISANATIEPVASTGDSTRLRVTLDPPGAARGADWFRVMAIHGGSTEQVDLRAVGGGTYVTERAVPVGGERDVVLRLARGESMASVMVYSAGDEDHEEAVGLGRRTAPFEPENALPPVSGWRADLQRAGYGVVAAVAAFWLFWIWRALARLEGRPLLPARLRRRQTSATAA